MFIMDLSRLVCFILSDITFHFLLQLE